MTSFAVLLLSAFMFLTGYWLGREHARIDHAVVSTPTATPSPPPLPTFAAPTAEVFSPPSWLLTAVPTATPTIGMPPERPKTDADAPNTPTPATPDVPTPSATATATATSAPAAAELTATVIKAPYQLPRGGGR